MNETRLLESIRENEGHPDGPYKDHLGNWTVGVGHLIQHTKVISLINTQTTLGELLDLLHDRDQHAAWLLEDVAQAIEDARRWLGFMFDELTDARQEVIVEMAFQMGYTRLSSFIEFRSAIADADWIEASDQMTDSLWARQTPKRANELAYKFRAG